MILLLQSTLSKYKEMNCAQIKKLKKEGLSRLHTYHFCGPIPVIQSSFKCEYFHTANDISLSSSNYKEFILPPPKSKGMENDGWKTQFNQIHLPPLGAASLPLCVSDSLQRHGLQPARGFSRQEHWSGWPCPPPGDLPHPGIKPRPPTWQADSLPPEPPGKPGGKFPNS